MSRPEQQQVQSDHQSDVPDGGRNPALSSIVARTPYVVDIDGRQPGMRIWGRHEEEAHQQHYPSENGLHRNARWFASVIIVRHLPDDPGLAGIFSYFPAFPPVQLRMLLDHPRRREAARAGDDSMAVRRQNAPLATTRPHAAQPLAFICQLFVLPALRRASYDGQL